MKQQRTEIFISDFWREHGVVGSTKLRGAIAWERNVGIVTLVSGKGRLAGRGAPVAQFAVFEIGWAQGPESKNVLAAHGEGGE